MNLDSFTGPGSTPSRRRFWYKVTAYVIASQKVAGRNVSVAEHQGKGTLINVVRERGPATGTTGACCNEGVCTQTTEEDCTGTFQGVGTPCDPNPCCTDCTGEFLFPPFSDGMGGCFTTQECDGSLSGPVPCDSLWLKFHQHCVGEEIDCAELCNITTIDPITCEQTNSCDCCSCCVDCVNGTVNSVSDQAFVCPELSPPP